MAIWNHCRVLRFGLGDIPASFWCLTWTSVLRKFLSLPSVQWHLWSADRNKKIHSSIFNDPKLGSKSPGAFSESYGNCCRVTVRIFQSQQVWDGNTERERLSCCFPRWSFHLLCFCSFCDYNVHLLQGSFDLRGDRKKNCTLLSKPKMKLWTNFKTEYFWSK